MQVLPIDVTAIVGIVMGVSIVLIPVAGLTARFALKPVVEAIARLFEHKGIEETVQVLEQRMALLETQMDSMDQSLRRVVEATEFHRELDSGPPRPSLSEGSEGEA